ncbi:hypothetical protein HNW13_018130 [Shewanella sp. BF02_Schw]|uniref:hypothetical protein n=1 Tax=Shewanella sp. BF02_Schw TaxID=394908 RepID=UPI00178176D7|nr:hypothetical protein [Shewanella sp. BF02_Schw]MBO1897659.1 hypothetical protein [Shewanella sp. BF02_Schw]
MKIILFDESDYKKEFWLIDSDSVLRYDSIESVSAGSFLTNLSAVNSILFQSQHPRFNVMFDDYLGSNINNLYTELVGGLLDLTDLSQIQNLYKVILNTCQKLNSNSQKQQSGNALTFPKLSLTKYSKNYISDDLSSGISRALRFSSVEIASIINTLGSYAGTFKKATEREVPNLKGFDGELADFYTNHSRFYFAKVKVINPDKRLAMYFQFGLDGLAVLPKSLLILLSELDDCEIKILELYLYDQDMNSSEPVLLNKMAMHSIAGWFSSGLINRIFCNDAFSTKNTSSVFYMDTIRLQTILRAEMLHSNGIKVNSIGPFEINCSINNDELELLELRAFEVGLYVC